MDDLSPLERRARMERAPSDPDAPLPAEFARWSDADRRALRGALLAQASLDTRPGRLTLREIDTFWTRSGARYRRLGPARPGALGVDLELTHGNQRTIVRDVHITPQTLVRGAPLLLLTANPQTAHVTLVSYIATIDRLRRPQEVPTMATPPRDTTVDQLRALCDSQAWDRAAEVIGQEYGPMVRRMLLSKLRDEPAAHAVWLQWYENVRKGLPKFRWQAQPSTWSYRIALNALFAYKRQQARAAKTQPWDEAYAPQPEGDPHQLKALNNRNHETTYDWVKTTNIHHFRNICQAHLSSEDQQLLAWRLHEQRPWREIATELAPDATPDDLRKATQRLHVRYHRLVKRLHKLAVQEGLVSPELEEP